MAKAGEVNYLQKLGRAGIAHAVNKPFSDVDCGTYLMAIGGIQKLLPAPPARLLDLGCGTGWTTCLFAKMGYDVVGQDIAPDMIHFANVNKQHYQAVNARFVVSDYEKMSFADEFDCAVFFDSLHHAIDERLALAKTFEALRSGGVCITREPGAGHSRSETSKVAVEKYGVTEKDMPPSRIMALGREIGYRKMAVFPYPETLFQATLPRAAHAGRFKQGIDAVKDGLLKFRRLRKAASRARQVGGLVLMTK